MLLDSEARRKARRKSEAKEGGRGVGNSPKEACNWRWVVESQRSVVYLNTNLE